MYLFISSILYSKYLRPWVVVCKILPDETLGPLAYIKSEMLKINGDK